MDVIYKRISGIVFGLCSVTLLLVSNGFTQDQTINGNLTITGNTVIALANDSIKLNTPKLIVGPTSGNGSATGISIKDTTIPVLNISSAATQHAGGNAFVRFDAPDGKYSGFDFGTSYAQGITFQNINGLISRHTSSGMINLNLQANGLCYVRLDTTGKISLGTDTLVGRLIPLQINSGRVVIGPYIGNGSSNGVIKDTANPVMNISSFTNQHAGGNAFVRFDAPVGKYSGLDFGTPYAQQTSMADISGLLSHHYANGEIDLSLQASGGYVTIKKDGNVKIGTVIRSPTVPDSIEMVATKVAVNGNLQVNGDLKIKTWTLKEAPDYVFGDNYKLTSLDTVEQFVKTNRHLPDVPSATTMSENGVDLVKMNMTLLKKVEELTLYVIDQQKQIKGQQAEIEGLKKSVMKR